jgi:hypothetical protein
MEDVHIPRVHDPASLYDREMQQKKVMPKQQAVYRRDKLYDLRKEPDWLLPELRMWMSQPEDIREAKVDNVIAGPLEAPFKENLLRYVFYCEKSRKILIKIVNFIAPKV